MDSQENKHKRRVRYKGKYPKKYQEKYKELHPEKYQEIVDHVIKKGSTPAGMHISIMVKEILEFLNIRPGQIGLDATLGYGGHSLEMLKCLDMKGHLYGLDIDPLELPKTKERLKKQGFDSSILTIKQLNFSKIDELVLESGLLDFVLADLGVSSMQIDNPTRGFSYKTDGPLDLRMNPEKGISAATRLRRISQPALAGMLTENADEPYAEIISKEIISEIKKGKNIKTTKQLRQIIEQALQFLPENNRDYNIKKSCQRSFQALRIDVNQEFQAIYDFLEKLPDALVSGGRVAVLSFHSGEDRLVKKSFKRLLREGVYKEISPGIIRPSEEECNLNRRARSTKMRWAIKA